MSMDDDYQIDAPPHLNGYEYAGSFHSSTDGVTEIIVPTKGRLLVFDPPVEHGLSLAVKTVGDEETVMIARVIQDIGGRGYVFFDYAVNDSTDDTQNETCRVTAIFAHGR